MIERNASCPCGSGKKYKSCCLRKSEDRLSLRHRIRRAEDELDAAIIQFALLYLAKLAPSIPKEEIIDWSWDVFTSGNLEDDEFADDALFEPLFLPWFFYGFRPVPEELVEELRPKEDKILEALRSISNFPTIGQAFLAQHGNELEPFSRLLLEALVANPFTYYRVLASPSPQTLRLLDLMTQREVEVSGFLSPVENLAGGIIFGRHFTCEGLSLFSAMAPYILEPECELIILDLMAGMAEKGIDLSMPRVHDRMLRSIYLEFENRKRKPAQPQMANTDGDPLEWTTLDFDLLCDPDDAFEALAKLCVTESKAELLEEGKFDAKGHLQSIDFHWMKRGNAKHGSWESTVLGNLEIRKGKLRVEVNSAKRARIIREKIVKLLGERVAFVRSKSESMQRMLEKEHSRRNQKLDRENEELMAKPEVQAVVRDMAERHWKEWLDTPVPALDDETPRDAAKTKDGRERLGALLRQFEWRNQRSSDHLSNPDVGALRRELGLEDPVKKT